MSNNNSKTEPTQCCVLTFPSYPACLHSQRVLMNAFFSLLLIVFCLLTTPFVSTVTAKDTWTSVRSNNYLVIGNASESDLRTTAVQLERFRDVFIKLFKGAALNSPVPTTVIVFNSDSSFAPYKPTFKGRRAD